MKTLIGQSPQTAQDFGTDLIYRLAHRLRDPAEKRPRRKDFLEALYAAKWRHADGRQPSALWLELTDLLLDDRDTARAIAVARDVTAPESRVILAVEHRFAPMFAACLPTGATSARPWSRNSPNSVRRLSASRLRSRS